MKFNKRIFFDKYKTAFGGLKQSQVDGLDFLLTSFESQPIFKTIPQIAYCLATIAHETAWTFKPIREYRAKVGSKGRANQDRYWLSGFYGRGYVQITWERNYRLLGKKIGVNLVAHPDKALEPTIAFDILLIGMSEGLFTNKKLSDYVYGNKADYVGARKVINGTDKAELIAGYAKAFSNCLAKALTDAKTSKSVSPEIENISIKTNATEQTAEGELTETVQVNEQPVTETAQVVEPEKQGVFAKLTGGVTALFSGTLIYTVAEKFGALSFSNTVLILLVVVVVIGFLGFCFWAVLDAWKANNRTKYEVEAKTRSDRKDLEWKK